MTRPLLADIPEALERIRAVVDRDRRTAALLTAEVVATIALALRLDQITKDDALLAFTAAAQAFDSGAA